MLGLNKVFVMGNLTRDPELRYTPNGQPVASFGIATNRRWSTPEGERRDEVEFHNIVAWGRPGEIINQYVKKGQPIFIEGRLKTQSWDAPDGSKRSRTEVIVENFQFLTFAGRDQAGAPAGGQGETSSNFGQANNFEMPNNGPLTSPMDMASGQPARNPLAGDPFANPADTPNVPTSVPPTVNPDDINIDDIPF